LMLKLPLLILFTDKIKIVICYFSAGTYEDWRPDANQFPASVLGASDGWPGERWLDIRKGTAVYNIMSNRFSLAAQKGCDGIEPDNIDSYTNNPGFPIKAADQLYYNTWLASEAHKFNLSIGLKNDLDQVPQLVSYFDWALDEQCYEYDECDCLKPFITAGKAVFGTEYTGRTSAFCPYFNDLKYSWLKKKLSLNSWVNYCITNTTIPAPRCLFCYILKEAALICPFFCVCDHNKFNKGEGSHPLNSGKAFWINLCNEF